MKKIVSLFVLVACMANVYSKNNPAGQETSPKKVQEQPVQKNKVNLYDSKKRRHGQWEFYWDDEVTVSNKGEYKHGKQVGTWYSYNQDGTLNKMETKKLLGNRYKTKVYYANGKLQKEGKARLKKDKEYLNYFWYGNWKCYDEQGNYVKTEKYKAGEVVE